MHIQKTQVFSSIEGVEESRSLAQQDNQEKSIEVTKTIEFLAPIVLTKTSVQLSTQEQKGCNMMKLLRCWISHN